MIQKHQVIDFIVQEYAEYYTIKINNGLIPKTFKQWFEDGKR